MSEIQLRQTIIDEIYNYRPSWIMRWGVTLFLLMLVLIIVVSGFIKYPDIIHATAEITTIDPPAHLVAHVNGKIEEIFIAEGDRVTNNKVLLVLESSANWEDLKQLDRDLSVLDSIFSNKIMSIIPHPSTLETRLKLGEIQVFYVKLITIYTELYRFLYLGFFKEEYQALNEKVRGHEKFLSQLKLKKQLSRQQLLIIESDLQRDSLLFKQEVIPKYDLQQSYQGLLQFKSIITDIDINIINAQSTLEQLKHNLKMSVIKHTDNKEQLIVRMRQSVRLLRSKTDMWKQKHLIVSPIKGIASFTTFWSKNQNVKAGEVVVSVVPDNSTKVRVRIQFPIQNSGKAKKGQRVNIKLHNYPYQEFGMLVGHLTGISKVPNDLLYSADVVLDGGFVTSYGEKLPRVQQLTGDAEILTDDLNLLMRFLNPLRAIFDSRLKRDDRRYN